jgi:enamine deaminase RidA (YjgF/YER057c/UK114 family)
MSTITRMHGGPRMSQIITHNSSVYLAGQVGHAKDDVTQQTTTCLKQIDARPAEAESDKTRLLQAIIQMEDMSDFTAMNAVWDAWVPEGHTPARA